jgi:hypothetical protein
MHPGDFKFIGALWFRGSFGRIDERMLRENKYRIDEEP